MTAANARWPKSTPRKSRPRSECAFRSRRREREVRPLEARATRSLGRRSRLVVGGCASAARASRRAVWLDDVDLHAEPTCAEPPGSSAACAIVLPRVEPRRAREQRERVVVVAMVDWSVHARPSRGRGRAVVRRLERGAAIGRTRASPRRARPAALCAVARARRRGQSRARLRHVVRADARPPTGARAAARVARPRPRSSAAHASLFTAGGARRQRARAAGARRSGRSRRRTSALLRAPFWRARRGRRRC